MKLEEWKMTPNKTSIKEFFQGDKQYTIPVYQRAYSWEEAQWSVFLEDLKEATKGTNHYFFGNVLLEKLSNDKPNDIIDGQQRITTIIIFARALCNVLRDKIEKDTAIILSNEEDVDNEEFIKRIEEDYLIARSKEKLQAVEYDKDYFKDFIIKGEAKHEPQTPSQKRIKEAKEFFEKALKKLDTKDILAVFEAIQKAEILSIPFTSKKDSVLMFELQNNRGKELTNMEKLKSYLAYQIYTYCGDNAENKLNEITKIFEEIYRLVNDIQTREDDILNYFNISISKFGFAYRENNDALNYKKELKEIEIEKKIEWIDKYIKELKNAFVDFKDFEKYENIYREYLQYLQITKVYPFIIKAYRLFRNDKNTLEQVFKALEIIAFRDKLVQTRADLATRLNGILKDFDSVDSLIDGLRKIYTNDPWYWGDNTMTNKLNNIFNENKGIIAYLLMRYENHLKSKNAQNRGYKFELKDIKNPEIEHIAPQTETIKGSGKDKASGYCEYDDEFNKGYMNCIGNLLLIAKSHNSSIGNEPFKEKLESYTNSPLNQQREIKDFVAHNEMWDKEAIDERHSKIEQFVLETWSFK